MDVSTEGLLETLLSLLTSIELARILDIRTATKDRTITGKEDIVSVLTVRGQQVNTANRERLSRELELQRKVISFFGEHLGLLLFTDFKKTPKTRFLWTSDGTKGRFQASIDFHMRHLNEIGGVLQDYIVNGVEPPEF